MSEKISLYNPRDTPPEQLEAMLTGREPLLQEILDSLREQVDSPTRQHWLLRGPRGIGKTHLTGILHHRIQGDAVLSKAYLPLWLGEADVYEVYSPATLLLRIAERLHEALPEAELDLKLRTLEGGDEDQFFEALTGLLTEESERQGRVLVVLMENLDALFESFAPKQRTEQTQQLRALLLGKPRFLFISTTPSRYVKELSDPQTPFFAQLQERKLSPLKVQEVGVLFTKLTQLTGRKDLLGQGAEASLKQRIIHQLTGGLPRSAVMAFEILRDKEGIQVLVEDLRTFLDAQTAYFEARLSRLAARERAIVTTLALADQNLTLKEISEKSLLPEKSLSTLVERLEQEGHVEAMKGTGGKGTLYGLSEGLFRIWYQYRKGRLLLEPLVRFLAYWYEPEELRGVVDSMKQRPLQPGTKPGRTMMLALLQVEAAFQIAISEQGRVERQRIWQECREGLIEASAPAPTELSPTLQQALSQGVALFSSGEEQRGRAWMDEALAKQAPPSQGMEEAILRFLLNQGVVIDEDGQVSGNLPLLSWMMEHFRDSPFDIARLARTGQFLLAEALRGLKRYTEASAQLDELFTWLSLQGATWSIPLLIWAKQSRATLLHDQGQHAQALLGFEEILAHTRDSETPFIRQFLPFTLQMLAKLYHLMGRASEGYAALQQLASISIENPSELLRRQIVFAKFLLILKDLETANSHEVQTTLETWCTEYQDVIPKLRPELLDLVNFTRRALHELNTQGTPSAEALHGLFRIAIPANPLMMAELFLTHAAWFIRQHPAEAAVWVEQLLATSIPEPHKQQLRLHRILLNLVKSASDKSPVEQEWLRQRLGRVTIEFRELFQELLPKLE